jgi:hypothetical protein
MNNDSMEIYKGIIQSYANLSLLALYTLQELLEEEIKMRREGFANIDEFDNVTKKPVWTVVKGGLE